MNGEHYAAIGMDVSDRKTQVCVMAKDGKSPKIVMETVIPTTKEGLAKFLSTQDRSAPVAFETGMHCRWMNEVAEGLGFTVYVANPCRLRMITEPQRRLANLCAFGVAGPVPRGCGACPQGLRGPVPMLAGQKRTETVCFAKLF